MPLTKGFTDELQILADYGAIGSAQGDFLPSTLDKINKHIDFPLRLAATAPTADAIFNIGPNQVTSGDDSIESTPPIDDNISAYAGATINFQTGATTGGTLQTDGGAFTLPTPTASNRFFRMVVVYNSTGNHIDTTFSSEAASEGALDPAGPMFAALDGIPVGYVDLESTNGVSSEFKTAASVTNIIENAKIVRFGSAAGAGGGGGGGGSGLAWNPVEGEGPVEQQEFGEKVFVFAPSIGETLQTYLKVPETFPLAGKPVAMKLALYSPASSNTVFLKTTATLIRKNTDAITSTTNQHTSTNSAITNTVANQYREIEVDLTDGSGLINGVLVAAGDIIKVELTRDGTDTDTEDTRFIPSATEATFE